MEANTLTSDASSTGAHRGLVIIDADVHAQPQPPQLTEYLAPRWREHVWGSRHSSALADLVRVRSFAARTDTWPSNGGAPGSDPALIVEQLLDRYGLTYAIADMIAVGTSGSGPRDYTEAICRATNEWTAQELFATDERWLGSINLPYEFGGASAVREIEHWSHEKRFVQVILSMRTEKPLGDPKYWDDVRGMRGPGRFRWPFTRPPGVATR